MPNNLFQTADGTNINYIDSKVGKPVIFIHGWGSSLKDYSEPMKVLSQKGFRCIALDLRGHGKSKATSGFTVAQAAHDVHQLIEHLELKDVALVGWSMGGAVVMSYVEQFGTQYLKKLIIADISPRLKNDDGWDMGLYKGAFNSAMFKYQKSLMPDHFNEFYGDFMYQVVNRSDHYKAAPFYFRWLSRIFAFRRKAEPNVLWTYWNSLYKADYRQVLSKILVPTAVFYPEPGSLFSPKTAEYIAENIPGKAELVPFTDADHLFVINQKEAFTQAVETFLNA